MNLERFFYNHRKNLFFRAIRLPLNIWRQEWPYFRAMLTKKLGFSMPKKFTEKYMYWRITRRDPLIVKCSDKIAVREYVKEKVGEEYLIPSLGVYKTAEEIDFKKLPDSFVLKTNNASGTNIFCSDKSKLDENKARKTLSKWIAQKNYKLRHLAWFYVKIPPKIICEKFVKDTSGELKDYKFWCFNGEPRYVWVDTGRYTDSKSRAIMDISWKKLPLKLDTPITPYELPKPENYDVMVELARTLSRDFEVVRVDLYNVEGIIYFGELTFASGDMVFSPSKYDKIWGAQLNLKSSTLV